MSMMKEFKDFAVKGNLVDIAVAFVMGAAFGKIVTAFNEGIVMPLVGQLLGGYDLSSKTYVLNAAVAETVDEAGAVITPAVAEVAVKWGAFLTATIDFVIIAFVMFMVIRTINNLKKKEEAAPAGPSSTDKLLMEIRDSLKK